MKHFFLVDLFGRDHGEEKNDVKQQVELRLFLFHGILLFNKMDELSRKLQRQPWQFFIPLLIASSFKWQLPGALPYFLLFQDGSSLKLQFRSSADLCLYLCRIFKSNLFFLSHLVALLTFYLSAFIPSACSVSNKLCEQNLSAAAFYPHSCTPLPIGVPLVLTNMLTQPQQSMTVLCIGQTCRF